MKRFLQLLVLSLVMAGCSEKPAEKPPVASSTPYGSPQEVTAYLQAVDPLVQQLNVIHQELYQKVGSSGKATGANLAPAMEEGRPKLQQILTQLEKTTPPPLLAPFHEQIKKVVRCRLDAYGLTADGWKQEQAKTPKFEDLYNRSEEKLSEAQQLGGQLGAERQRIQQALAQAQAPPQASTR